ncbi:MAG: serine hydrolase [Vicinamibacteria bacterium]
MRPLLLLLFLTSVASAATKVPAPSPTPAPIERLKSSIERITRGVNATWGIYVRCLETGEEISINADQQMDTMSVIKIPLMAEIFEQLKTGTFKLTDKYTLSAEDIRPGTGTLRSMDPGAVMTVKDLITYMIIVSDNTATDVLYRMVGGPEVVTKRMEAYGLKSTKAPWPSARWFADLRAAASAEEFHRQAKTPFGLSSPREIGLLLERMEKGTLVDEDSSKLMLQIMRGQLYRTRIPRFLSGWRIPHKTGDFLPYIGNDVGVLEAPGRTVILSVFTAHHFGSGEALEDAIGRVAEQIGAYFMFRN